MKLAEFNRATIEAYSAWDVLRSLGFDSDEIFWIVQPTLNAIGGPGLTLNIQLRRHGQEFTITCSERLTEEQAHALLEEAQAFQEAANCGDFTSDELKQACCNTMARTRAADLILALRLRGFQLPFRTRKSS